MKLVFALNEVGKMFNSKITRYAGKGIKLSNGGFTLIELMIVVAIVAILAAIAYPAYTSQIMKADRSDARAALLAAAQSLEKCYTEYNAYNNAACPALSAASPEGYYTIDEPVARTADAYTLRATPNSGAVMNDKECLTIMLDSKGTKTSTGTGTKCW